MSRKKIMLASARMAAWEQGLPRPKALVVSEQEPPRRKAAKMVSPEVETESFVETIPIPNADPLDVAFRHGGTSGAMRLLPKYEDLTREEQRCRGLYCEAASGLFNIGGKLEDFGIRPKKGVDPKKLYRWLKATLPDFAPSHEHKIGGVGHMLAKWCEPTGKAKQ